MSSELRQGARQLSVRWAAAVGLADVTGRAVAVQQLLHLLRLQQRFLLQSKISRRKRLT